jgi:simple sugar transport system substrate-binding protein
MKPRWPTAIASIMLIVALLAGCTPAPQIVEVTRVVEATRVVEVTRAVQAPTPVATPTQKFPGAGTVTNPYTVTWAYTGGIIQSVDFAFVGAFSLEIAATQTGLKNPTVYNWLGRKLVVGEVPDLPGYKAVALETLTQQGNTDQALTLLPFYFPPKNATYIVGTLGGIAGGFNTQFVPGAPDLQPGDSLAAAGACNVTFNTYQPALTQGYVMVGPQDTVDTIAQRLTGDKSRGQELYAYNARRLRYTSTADVKPGDVLLTPANWPPNTIQSYGLPRGTNIMVNNQSLSFKPLDPCIYLSPKALALRDEILARMQIPPLPADVIAYRQRNFPDARTAVKVFSGDWKEGGGHGWFGDPWIARDHQTKFHVAMSDMETGFSLAAVTSRWPASVTLEPNSTTIRRLETDWLIYRTSSDPPDLYRGTAFAVDDFLKDQTGTMAKVSAAYMGEGTQDQIPFMALIAAQSAQFREFNFSAARLAVANLTTAIKPEPSKAPTPPAATSADFIFGVVMVGPYNDHGWSEAHYDAGKYVEAKIPGAKMIYVDNVNPAAKPGVTVPQVVDDLLSKGAKLVITNSDDFKDGTLEAAVKNPNLPIVNISGDHAWKDGKDYRPQQKNLSNIMGRMEYGKMIAGCAAALTTQTGKIGYLGPLINDETRRLASSAYLGAKYCWQNYAKKDPKELKFKVTWIGFWFNIPGQTLDPTKVADEFYTTGYDVVLSGIDTTEALVEAGKMVKAGKKVWAIPYDYKGACAEAVDVCLGVPYFNWGPAYVKAVSMVKAGKWAQYFDWNGPDWQNINNPDTSAVGYVNGNALTKDNADKVGTFIKGLADGSINLFTGPIRFQDGSDYLKDGVVATDLQVWYLSQLLEGIEGPSK